MRFLKHTYTVSTFLCILLFSGMSNAASYYGMRASYAAIASEPKDMHGYQLMLSYYPPCLRGRKFSLFFEGGYSHFWLSRNTKYDALNAYSVAPVLRNVFKKHGPVLPYLEISIGLAYLSQTRIDDRNLGMHFAFQDRVGVGVLLGNAERLNISLSIMHYSNAHLSEHNNGITIPLLLDVGYKM